MILLSFPTFPILPCNIKWYVPILNVYPVDGSAAPEAYTNHY